MKTIQNQAIIGKYTIHGLFGIFQAIWVLVQIALELGCQRREGKLQMK